MVPAAQGQRPHITEQMPTEGKGPDDGNEDGTAARGSQAGVCPASTTLHRQVTSTTQRDGNQSF